MDFRWPDEYLAFRDEVEAFIHEWHAPSLAAEMRGVRARPGHDAHLLQGAAGRRRLDADVLARRDGRQGAIRSTGFILVETMEYWRMPSAT
ncbi:MAG: hypothetical protein R3F21_04575 [Myxococcota bacterium]